MRNGLALRTERARGIFGLIAVGSAVTQRSLSRILSAETLWQTHDLQESIFKRAECLALTTFSKNLQIASEIGDPKENSRHARASFTWRA